MSNANVSFLNKVISSQLVLAHKAENACDAPKAKKAYETILTNYRQLIVADPTHRPEYEEKIFQIEKAITNLSMGLTRKAEGPTPAKPTKPEPKKDPVKTDSVSKKEDKPCSDKKVSINEEELQEGLNALNGLIGITSVKEAITEWVNQIRIDIERQQYDLAVAPNTYHMVFTGNPGTGKTTVARLIAKIYHALGITDEEKTIETSQEDLVVGYVNQTSARTKEVIESAMGGILFIDEAYRLTPDISDGKDFGKEAVETLLKYTDNPSLPFACIVAGYAKEMKRFISANPGLPSRFVNFIDFPDYLPQELYQIFLLQLKKYEYVIAPEAEQRLLGYFNSIYAKRSRGFGNGREARNIAEKVRKAQSQRLAKLPCRTKEQLCLITGEDVTNAIARMEEEKAKNE